MVSTNPIFYTLTSKSSTNSVEDAIKVSVGAFMEKYYWKYGLGLPINLNKLCKSAGIRLFSVVMKNDALLCLDKKGYAIHFNRSITNVRRARFSIAHEITHLIIIRICGEKYQINDEATFKRIELLCDLGAAEILMPNEYFKIDFNKEPNLLGKIKRLRKNYYVSFHAIFKRINSISPHISIHIWKKKDYTDSSYVLSSCFQKYTKNLDYPWLPQGCSEYHYSPTISNVHTNEVPTLQNCKIQLQLGNRTNEFSTISCPFFLFFNSANQYSVFNEEEVHSYVVFLFPINKKLLL